MRCRIGSCNSGSFRDTKKKLKKGNKKRITNTGITGTGKSYLGNFPNFGNFTRKIVAKAEIREISKNAFMREGDSIFLQNA